MLHQVRYTFLGLDLGQRQDFSALAVVDLAETVSTRRDPVTCAFLRDQTLILRSLERFPLGTDYTELAAHARRHIVTPPPFAPASTPKASLAIDAGGPGGPVVNMFRHAGLPCDMFPVMMTSGVTGGDLARGGYSAPRRELAGLLRVALESRMLRIPGDLPLCRQLLHEIRTFSPIGGQSEHDDMAVAVALALWVAHRRFPGLVYSKKAA